MREGGRKIAMSDIRILSWNVNGIRAVYKKGFIEWLLQEEPDIVCIQETKAWEEQLVEELRKPEGYFSYFAEAERKGYSGAALYTRAEPLQVRTGFSNNRFDTEGRTLAADFGDFMLYNVYFPNGKASKERLQYKMDFYDAFLDHVKELRQKGRKVVVCGDVNTAHREIDLARPRENENVSGFLPEERAWIDRLLQVGFTDTFRTFSDQPGQYTWWDMKTRARERNIGWRIDYFFVSDNLREAVRSASILSDVQGSDHCPIEIELLL
jgi:exodeoxyribonuclease-3